MGYTHYWTQPKDFTAAKFAEIAADIGNIIAISNVSIADGNGSGAPTLTKKIVSFNGAGDEDSHETFHIEAKRELPYEGCEPSRLGWSFCKTAYKPYDVVVVAALAYLAAQHGFDVGSDGGPRDWEAGVALARKALPDHVINNPIKEDA